MLALAVAAVLELDLRTVVEALGEVTLPHGRCEIIRSRDLLIVHDAYNANPASMLAALETAQALRGKRPLAVLVGSMLELGGESRRLHREMADAILAAEPALVGAVGEFVAAFQPHAKRLGSRLVTAPDADALGRAVAERLGGDELVLLKASRGVALEQALRHVVPGWEDACSTTS
jgi:UDP-N-acetylmuramoyl-tripeptide--D-alanyl-D-alanine ligase